MALDYTDSRSLPSFLILLIEFSVCGVCGGECVYVCVGVCVCRCVCVGVCVGVGVCRCGCV